MKLKKFLIPPTLSIKETLKRLDAGGEKTLFITDPEKRLIGSVTDGDIRRAILAHRTLQQSIRTIYNAQPLSLPAGYSPEEARELMVTKKIEVVPVVDPEKRVVDIVLWTDLFGKKTPFVSRRLSVPLVVMAGGKGERLSPFTRILPKPLIPVGEETIIERIIGNFAAYGIRSVYVTLNYKADLIKAYLDGLSPRYRLRYITEKEYLGTAGSLRLLPRDIGDMFIVSNCDIIVTAPYDDLIRFHTKHKNLLTVVGSIQHYKIPYGVIHFGESGRVTKIVEKPEFDFTINTGVYVCSREIISMIPRGRPFNMTDLIETLLTKNGRVGVYPVSHHSYIDIGQLEEYKTYLQKFSW